MSSNLPSHFRTDFAYDEQFLDRMDPHHPMPNPITGELKIDPDIRIKSQNLDITCSFFYSSLGTYAEYPRFISEFGLNRSASVFAYFDVIGHDIMNPNSLFFVYRGDFRTSVGYLGTGWISGGERTRWTTPSEYFSDGTIVDYPTSGEGYISRVRKGASTHTYTYDTHKFTITAAGGSLEFDFNSIGTSSYVTLIRDHTDRRWTFLYDPNGVQTQMTTPGGCSTRYSYTWATTLINSSLLASIEDPRGFRTSYTYDSQRRVISMVAGDAVWSWDFTGSGQSVEITPTGARTTYHFDSSSGHLTSLERPEGYTTNYGYNLIGLKATESIPAGTIVSLQYTNASLLQVSDDALGNRTTYVSSPNYGITNPNGNRMTYTGGLYEISSVTDYIGRQTSYSYDGVGQLHVVTDPRLYKTTYSWDSRGNIVSIQSGTSALDLSGNFRAAVTTMVYDLLGRMIQRKDPLGRNSYYGYDVSDNLVTMIDTSGAWTTYVYDTCLLVAVVDPLGNRTSFTYDRYSNKTSEQDALGNVTSYVYDNMGALIAVIDPLGHTTTTVYNAAKQKIAEIDPLGRYTSYVYEGSGRLWSIQDPAGFRTTFAYNARGDLINVYDANPTFVTPVTYTFDKLGRQIAVTNKLGQITTLIYDDMGQLTGSEDALSNVTQYSYDGSGNRIGVMPPLGAATSYIYGPDSLLIGTQFHYPGGSLPFNQITNTYDIAGQLIATIDTRGYITSYAYDSGGRLSTVDDAYANDTAYTYDLAGRRVSITDALGRMNQTVYDAVGRVVSSIAPGGRMWQFMYDSVGRRTVSIDPMGARTTNTYDAAGQLVSFINELGFVTTYSYDLQGNQISVQDPRGNLLGTVYGPTGLVLAIVDPFGNRTTNTYDAADRLVSIQDPRNNTSAFTYDANGNLLTSADQLAFKTTYTYDANQRLKTRKFPSGDVTTYSYDPILDARNRLSTIQYADGTLVGYWYDLTGNLTTMLDSIGTTTYAYDRVNRLIGKTSPGGLAQQNVYDSIGRRVSMIDPDGVVRSNAYNVPGDLVHLYVGGTIYADMVYDPLGRRTTLTRYGPLGSYGTKNFWYDLAGQMISSVDPTGLAQTYTYDGNGNKLTVQDGSSALTTYAYDAKNRLTQDSTTGANAHVYNYSYDATDNILSNDESGTLTSSTYDAANRLVTSVAGTNVTTFTYDANGNQTLVQDPSATTTMVYDKENRLSVHKQSSSVATYLYDGNGQKLVELVDGARTTLVWDGDDYLQSRS